MITRWLTAASGGDFDPLTLSPLVYYDPLDMSTLWQDTAGTTPVTASGQTVRRIDDKSGNGYHALSRNGGGAILTASGYLDFTGVTDALIVTVPTFNYPAYLISAIGCDSSRRAGVAIAAPSVEDQSVGVGHDFNLSARAFVFKNTFAQSNQTVANNINVLTGQFLSASQRLRVNSGAWNSDIGVTSPPANVSSLAINTINRLSPVYYESIAGGVLYFDRALTAAELDDCEQWLMSRYGVA